MSDSGKSLASSRLWAPWSETWRKRTATGSGAGTGAARGAEESTANWEQQRQEQAEDEEDDETTLTLRKWRELNLDSSVSLCEDMSVPHPESDVGAIGVAVADGDEGGTVLWESVTQRHHLDWDQCSQRREEEEEEEEGLGVEAGRRGSGQEWKGDTPSRPGSRRPRSEPPPSCSGRTTSGKKVGKSPAAWSHAAMNTNQRPKGAPQPQARSVNDGDDDGETLAADDAILSKPSAGRTAATTTTTTTTTITATRMDDFADVILPTISLTENDGATLIDQSSVMKSCIAETVNGSSPPTHPAAPSSDHIDEVKTKSEENGCDKRDDDSSSLKAQTRSDLRKLGPLLNDAGRFSHPQFRHDSEEATQGSQELDDDTSSLIEDFEAHKSAAKTDTPRDRRAEASGHQDDVFGEMEIGNYGERKRATVDDYLGRAYAYANAKAEDYRSPKGGGGARTEGFSFRFGGAIFPEVEEVMKDEMIFEPVDSFKWKRNDRQREHSSIAVRAKDPVSETCALTGECCPTTDGSDWVTSDTVTHHLSCRPNHENRQQEGHSESKDTPSRKGSERPDAAVSYSCAGKQRVLTDELIFESPMSNRRKYKGQRFEVVPVREDNVRREKFDSNVETKSASNADIDESDGKVQRSFTDEDDKVPRSFTDEDDKVPRSFTDEDDKVPRSFTDEDEKVPRSFTDADGPPHTYLIEGREEDGEIRNGSQETLDGRTFVFTDSTISQDASFLRAVDEKSDSINNDVTVPTSSSESVNRICDESHISVDDNADDEKDAVEEDDAIPVKPKPTEPVQHPPVNATSETFTTHHHPTEEEEDEEREDKAKRGGFFHENNLAGKGRSAIEEVNCGGKYVFGPIMAEGTKLGAAEEGEENPDLDVPEEGKGEESVHTTGGHGRASITWKGSSITAINTMTFCCANPMKTINANQPQLHESPKETSTYPATEMLLPRPLGRSGESFEAVGGEAAGGVSSSDVEKEKENPPVSVLGESDGKLSEAPVKKTLSDNSTSTWVTKSESLAWRQEGLGEEKLSGEKVIHCGSREGALLGEVKEEMDASRKAKQERNEAGDEKGERSEIGEDEQENSFGDDDRKRNDLKRGKQGGEDQLGEECGVSNEIAGIRKERDEFREEGRRETLRRINKQERDEIIDVNGERMMIEQAFIGASRNPFPARLPTQTDVDSGTPRHAVLEAARMSAGPLAEELTETEEALYALDDSLGDEFFLRFCLNEDGQGGVLKRCPVDTNHARGNDTSENAKLPSDEEGFKGQQEQIEMNELAQKFFSDPMSGDETSAFSDKIVPVNQPKDDPDAQNTADDSSELTNYILNAKTGDIFGAKSDSFTLDFENFVTSMNRKTRARPSTVIDNGDRNAKTIAGDAAAADVAKGEEKAATRHSEFLKGLGIHRLKAPNCIKKKERPLPEFVFAKDDSRDSRHAETRCDDSMPFSKPCDSTTTDWRANSPLRRLAETNAVTSSNNVEVRPCSSAPEKNLIYAEATTSVSSELLEDATQSSQDTNLDGEEVALSLSPESRLFRKKRKSKVGGRRGLVITKEGHWKVSGRHAKASKRKAFPTSAMWARLNKRGASGSCLHDSAGQIIYEKRDGKYFCKGVRRKGQNINFNSGEIKPCTEAKASVFIGEYLFELWKNQCLCDVRIQSPAGPFLAHKIVLAAFSDVFCPVEPQPEPELCVDVPNTTGDAVYQVLLYLYTSEMELSDDTLEEVLNAAIFLGVTDVVDLIKEILQNPTKDNFMKYLDIACRSQLPISLMDMPHLFRDNLHELWDTRPFKILSVDDMINVLKDPEVLMNSESDALEAVCKWADYCLPDRIPDVINLLQYVNFVCIDPKTLVRVVEKYEDIFDHKDMQHVLAHVFKSFALNSEVKKSNQNLAFGIADENQKLTKCKDTGDLSEIRQSRDPCPSREGRGSTRDNCGQPRDCRDSQRNAAANGDEGSPSRCGCKSGRDPNRNAAKSPPFRELSPCVNPCSQSFDGGGGCGGGKNFGCRGGGGGGLGCGPPEPSTVQPCKDLEHSDKAKFAARETIKSINEQFQRVFGPNRGANFKSQRSNNRTVSPWSTCAAPPAASSGLEGRKELLTSSTRRAMCGGGGAASGENKPPPFPRLILKTSIKASDTNLPTDKLNAGGSSALSRRNLREYHQMDDCGNASRCLGPSTSLTSQRPMLKQGNQCYSASSSLQQYKSGGGGSPIGNNKIISTTTPSPTPVPGAGLTTTTITGGGGSNNNTTGGISGISGIGSGGSGARKLTLPFHRSSALGDVNTSTMFGDRTRTAFSSETGSSDRKILSPTSRRLRFKSGEEPGFLP